MKMLIEILDSYPLQLLIAAHMFAWYFPRRSHFRLRFLIHAIPMLLVYNIGMHTLPRIENYYADRASLILAVIYMALGIFLCYRCSAADAVYATASAHPAQNILFNIYWIAKTRMGFEEGSLTAVTVSIPVMVIVYSVIFFFFARRMKDWEENESVRLRLTFYAGAVMLYVIFGNPRISGAVQDYKIYLSYVMGDALALLMQYGLLTESGLGRRNEVMEQLLYAEQHKQRMTAENAELINRKCHDLKHQISGLRRMGVSREREAYIREIERAVMFFDASARTGNETLDLILMDKQLLAERHHISITCVTDGSRLDHLDTMDLYALFGNALDNAIESVSREPDPSKRVISLRIGTRGDFLAIHMENYVSEPVTIEHGMPVTTKADTRYHGFGMLSMKRIAEKYNGYMNVGVKDQMFSLDFLIPLPVT